MSKERFDRETGEIAETPQNLRHWDLLSTTDPKHTKPFQRPGGFRGTAIRPIWNQYRLTEHFGPHGVGWGTDEPRFQLVEADGEILVFCTMRCWYMDNDNKRAEIYGVGGDKVLARYKEGPRSDDEAFKKAFTDALGNAFQRIGVSADVHMGLFENSKYVDEARRQFAPQGEADGVASTQTAVAPPAARTARTARTARVSKPAVVGNGATQPAATRASPAVAQRDASQDAPRRAYKALQQAIDTSQDANALREVYDAVLDVWGGMFDQEVSVIRATHPSALDLLKARLQTRLQQIGAD